MLGVVLVDMDNVIADFDARFVDRWAERFPDQPAAGRWWRRHHRIVEDCPSDWQAQAAALIAEEGFTLGMRPVEGAREGLAEMVAEGLLVYVCTSPVTASSTNASEKLEWVTTNLGPSWSARTIIAKDKTAVRGDVLIDDALAVSGAMTPTWRHVVFSRPFNLHRTVPVRLDWTTWRHSLRGLVSSR